MTDEQRNKCKQILEHYGAENQRRQLCEECAELIQAAIKYDRKGRNLGANIEAYSHLCEELADVMIMIEQVRLTVSENMVNSFINEKIERQMRRIESEVHT